MCIKWYHIWNISQCWKTQATSCVPPFIMNILYITVHHMHTYMWMIYVYMYIIIYIYVIIYIYNNNIYIYIVNGIIYTYNHIYIYIYIYVPIYFLSIHLHIEDIHPEVLSENMGFLTTRNSDGTLSVPDPERMWHTWYGICISILFV